jgi:hypothetical protein
MRQADIRRRLANMARAPRCGARTRARPAGRQRYGDGRGAGCTAVPEARVGRGASATGNYKLGLCGGRSDETRGTGGSYPQGGRQNFEINPMKEDETRLGDPRRAPKCGAKTRAGTPCQRPAIHGRKRCRLHGGLSPGAPRGAKNGNFRDGDWTAEAIEERKWLRSLVRSFAKTGTIE